MKLSKFKFDMPTELLAEYPAPNRDESRMMVVNRKEGTIEHKVFKDVIDYMKERQRLLKRILLTLLEDKVIGKCFEEFCREVNWKKLYLKESDRYHFRAKYYKADYRLFDY